MQVVENVALISINATLVIQLVSFLFFMVLLNRVMIRPLRVIMNERETYIEQVGKDLVDAGDAFDQITVQISRQEEKARTTAFQIRDEIETSGRQSVADLLSKTKSEIDGFRSDAKRETDRKLVEARKDLDAEAEMIADKMVSALLGSGRQS